MNQERPMTRLWLKHYWFQLVVAAACILKGAATTAPVFGIVPAAPYWPYILWATAAIVLASTFAPFSGQLQALAGASLVAVAVVRITAYLYLLRSVDLPTDVVALAWYLIGGWVIAGAVGMSWGKLADDSGLAEAVEQGREECG